MAQQRPGNARVLELRGGDLARIGARGLAVGVLGGDAEGWGDEGQGREEVQGGRGDDYFGVRVGLGGVDVLDYRLDAGQRAVPKGKRGFFSSVSRSLAGALLRTVVALTS